MRQTIVTSSLLALTCLGLGCSKKANPEKNSLKEIRPEFPRPVFISDVWDCTLQNFALPFENPPIKVFTAPIGSEIVSINKPVSGRDRPTQGSLEWITDGESFCGSGGEYEVWFGEIPSWIRIDLETAQYIDQIWLWHGQGSLARRQTPEVFEDVIIQISNDVDFQRGVTTLFNSDDDGSCGQGAGGDATYMETNHGLGVSAKGQRARYVRVWGGKAYSGGPCRLVEVTVWGR